MRPKRPTIKDVARHAGVSFKTVSRVINREPGVRPEVQDRVRQAIAALGYVVNHSARSLAAGRSHTIGLVIPRITDPYTFQLIHHVGEVSERTQTEVIILSRPAAADALSLSSFIGNGIVGALLLVTPRGLDTYLATVSRLDLPTVVIETLLLDQCDCPIDPPVPCVASDNRGGAQAGVSHLLDLGHQRIAFIGRNQAAQSRLRYGGYVDALAERGVPLREAYVRPGDWTWESGYDQAGVLLDLDEPPTAIFCASDNMALGALRAVQQRGLHVPQDLSLLGFDDIPAAAAATPPLTTVRQQTLAMVEQAFALLLGALNGEPLAACNRLLPTELVVRASTGPAPGT